MAKITELLTRRHASLAPGATLDEAARAMLDGDLSALLVVEDGRLLGIVTERDLVHALRTRGGPAQPLGALMSSPVHVAPPDQDWRDAYRDSVRHGCRHIVVAGDDGKPLGVVSESEVIRHLGSDFFRRVTTVDALMERLFPCLPPDAPLSAALAAMEAQRASCAVVAEARRPLGILTEGDVARLLLAPGDDPPLADVMTAGVVALPATASLATAVDTMAQARIRHLLALDGRGEVAGILSEHTLLGLLGLDVADEVQADRQSLERSRDQIRDRLLRHERYQNELFDNFPFPVWLKDTESRFLAVNRRYAETAGRETGETLIGQSDFDLWPNELAEHSRAEESAVMAERRRRTGLEALPVGHSRIWHEVHRAPVVGADGTVLGTVGFALDVSGHKRDEEAIVLRSAALAGLARNEPLNGILELIALSVEREIPDGRCAILLADDDGRTLRIGAAPSLSDAERRTMDGIAADAADDGSSQRRHHGHGVDEDEEREAEGEEGHDGLRTRRRLSPRRPPRRLPDKSENAASTLLRPLAPIRRHHARRHRCRIRRRPNRARPSATSSPIPASARRYVWSSRSTRARWAIATPSSAPSSTPPTGWCASTRWSTAPRS